jgi:hypothetical protein
MASIHHVALKHLKTGTITAAEKRYFLYASPVKYYHLIRAATVSG